MDVSDLYERIKLARTPTIATEDALTVARLHDLVIEYVLAKQAYNRHPHSDEMVRLNAAEYALIDVSGVDW